MIMDELAMNIISQLRYTRHEIGVVCEETVLFRCNKVLAPTLGKDILKKKPCHDALVGCTK